MKSVYNAPECSALPVQTTAVLCYSGENVVDPIYGGGSLEGYYDQIF